MGILICYDQRFPEPARLMALNEEYLILTPANLPINAEAYANFFNRTIACENRLFIISANRIGEKKNIRFIGWSQIVCSSGQILA